MLTLSLGRVKINEFIGLLDAFQDLAINIVEQVRHTLQKWLYRYKCLEPPEVAI